jgi:hypothetical protein
MDLIADDRRGPPAKRVKWVEDFDLKPQTPGTMASPRKEAASRTVDFQLFQKVKISMAFVRGSDQNQRVLKSSSMDNASSIGACRVLSDGSAVAVRGTIKCAEH